MQICVLFKNSKNSHSRENGDLFFWIPNRVGNEKKQPPRPLVRGNAGKVLKSLEFESSEFRVQS